MGKNHYFKKLMSKQKVHSNKTTSTFHTALCTEFEGRKLKKVYLYRLMINGKQRLSLIDREERLTAILFLLIQKFRKL